MGEHIYGNNSIVTVDDIAENDSALLCYTNSDECCENGQQASNREWYFPSGTTVGTNVSGVGFYRNRGPSVVRLNRRNNAMMPTGVFRCEIPDASGTNQSIYVGIYPEGSGSPKVNEPLFYSANQSLNTQILTCISTGGPATKVLWKRNGALINQMYHAQFQRIIDVETSKYENVLSLGSKSPVNITGKYSCIVSNARNQTEQNTTLHGTCIFCCKYKT